MSTVTYACWWSWNWHSDRRPQVPDISVAQKHMWQLWGFSFRLGSRSEPSTSGNESGEVEKKDVTRPITTPWLHSTHFQSMIPNTNMLHEIHKSHIISYINTTLFDLHKNVYLYIIYMSKQKSQQNSSSDVTFTPTWIKPSIIRTRPKGSVSHTSTC